jgi:ligand-binding sensor domain-containing protein
MPRSKHIFSCILLTICCVTLNAQKNFLFTHLGLRDGLASNIVHRVQQDANGYIWLIANNKLQRYDGYRFQTFVTGKNSLPEGTIRGFDIDKKNRMWLHINDSTLGYMNADNFSWTAVKVQIPEGWGKRGSGLFITNANSPMLVFPGQGFITYNETTNTAAEKYNPFSLPAGWKILNTWQDKKNNYWFGTTQGLVKYNPTNKKLSYSGNNAENDSSITAFADVKMTSYFFIDRNNRKWLGSWPEETGLSLKSLEPNGKVKEWNPEIAKAQKGMYYTNFGVIETATTQWIAGGNLFAWFDDTFNKFQLIPSNSPGEYSIRFDLVHHLYEDREKNIWVSTNKGLYRFNPPNQVLQMRNNFLPGNDSAFTSEVTDFHETSSGELLVSTWGNGIFSYDKNFRPVSSKIFPNKTGNNEGMVWSMTEMNNGDLWWGAQGGFLCHYDFKTKGITRTQPAMIQQRTVRQVEKDQQENLWIGTHGGHIIKYIPTTKEWILVKKVAAVVSRLLVSTKNEVWVATDIDGVYRFNAIDGKLIQHYTNALPQGKRLLINGSPDMAQYNDSTMIILSNGFNILNTRTNNMRYLHQGTDFFNITVDKKSLVWASMPLGIIAQSLKNETIHFTFDERDGIDNFSFSSAASSVLKDGSVAFGNNHGYVSFHPDKIMQTFIQYKFDKVKLSEIYVNDRKLPVDSVVHLKLLKLGPGNVSLKARFTTNTFQTLYAISYLIEGLDTAWKQTSGMGEVSLNYLPAGKYILKAAILNEHKQPQEIISIPIEVAAPFYKTAWFLLILLVIFLAALYWFDRLRMKRRDELLKVRRGIANNLHDDISNTLEKINILSEMAVLKNENDPEKSREFLAQIKQVSSNMISAMQDMLWAISPENDKTEKLMTRLVRYVHVLNNRHSMNIDIATDENLKKTKFDMQLRYEILLLFKHSIKSLINAGAEDIRIYLGSEKKGLLYNVQFSHKNADRRLLNNFFNSKDLADKVQAINGTITSNVGTRSAEIECKIHV